MAPKKAPSAKPLVKKVRNTIEFKKNIIEQYDSGVRVGELARMYNKSRTTISSIIAKKKEIKEAIVAKGVNMLTKMRSPVLEEVEKLLLVWINKKQLAGDSLTTSIICEKARQSHDDLVKKWPATSSDIYEFKASKGWFERFKKRSGIHSVVTSSRPVAQQVHNKGSQPSGQEEKKSPVVICLDLPDESCTIYKEISNVPENSQKKMRNEESMGGDVSETQKLDVSIKAKEGVWRSGRVRKRSSKLADFASTAEVDVLFRQYSDGPGSLHNDSNVSLI
ncbi:putative CENPB DNA-binding domain-containing protein 1 isoform X5 [Cherax quadricarinatus]|uniref:putative CENPB DNA-binding domain-containing protein 1 isoform X5 n=1 Tax=Cherax quadricarinatus TaxID=27406 RepID=UPI00387EB602